MNGAMGGAVSSAIARALGRGDRSGAESLVWHALAIAVGAALLFTALYFTWGKWLLVQTGAPAAVTDEAARYGSFAMEALINALAHRDYSAASGGVSIHVYPHLLEIWNSGPLPDRLLRIVR